jgi:hypothetical protein
MYFAPNLIISDLELAVRKTDDNIHILNQQLNIVLGLDLNETLIPDSSLLSYSPGDEDVNKLMMVAFENNKELQTATKEIEAAKRI